MHPKSLEDLCLDAIVLATVNYRLHCSDPQMLWRGVRALWSKLWYGAGVASTACSLLLANLSWAKIPDEQTMLQQLWFCHVAPTFLTCLAADCPAIVLPVKDYHIATPFPQVNINQWSLSSNEEHRLRVLDISTLDFGDDIIFLERVLSRCPNLSVLKLGFNVTDGILYAARCCPLKTLQLFEKTPCRARVSMRVLYKFLLGIREKDQKQLMDDIHEGRRVQLNSAWPQLLDLCTGNCALTKDFFILVLVAFPDLQEIDTSVISIQEVILEYGRLSTAHSKLPPLNLQSSHGAYGNFWVMHTHLPQMKKVWINDADGLEMYIELLLQVFAENLPCVSALRLPHIPISSSLEFPLTVSSSQGTDCITELEIDGFLLDYFNVKCLFTLLKLFPAVRRVCIIGSKLLIQDIELQIRFTSVTSLECVCGDSNDFIDFLKVFPNIKYLTLVSLLGSLAFPWARLAELRELRVLRLYGRVAQDLDGLCSVPRHTSNRSQWRLHTPRCNLQYSTILRLQRNGWTYIPDGMHHKRWIRKL